MDRINRFNLRAITLGGNTYRLVRREQGYVCECCDLYGYCVKGDEEAFGYDGNMLVEICANINYEACMSFKKVEDEKRKD